MGAQWCAPRHNQCFPLRIRTPMPRTRRPSQHETQAKCATRHVSLLFLTVAESASMSNIVMLRAVAVLAWRVSCAKRSRANMGASASGNVEGRRGKFTAEWGDQFFFGLQTRNRAFSCTSTFPSPTNNSPHPGSAGSAKTVFIHYDSESVTAKLLAWCERVRVAIMRP